MAESPAPLSGGKLVAVALVFASVAALINLLYVNWVRQQNEMGSIDVCVLDRAVKPGQKVSERDIKVIKVPKTFSSALFSDEAGRGTATLDAVKHEVILTMATAGDKYERAGGNGMIVTYDLFRKPEDDPTDRLVLPGMVMVSLPIDGKNQPGNLTNRSQVDIAAPFLRTGTIPEVLPVMENVKVLALDRHVVEDESASDTGRRSGSASRVGNFRSISIMVKPEIALKLLMIESIATGEFHLLVRNPSDVTVKIPPDTINPEVLALLEKRLGK